MRAGEGGGPFQKGPPPSPAPPSPFPKLFNFAETGGRKKERRPAKKGSRESGVVFLWKGSRRRRPPQCRSSERKRRAGCGVPDGSGRRGRLEERQDAVGRSTGIHAEARPGKEGRSGAEREARGRARKEERKAGAGESAVHRVPDGVRERQQRAKRRTACGGVPVEPAEPGDEAGGTGGNYFPRRGQGRSPCCSGSPLPLIINASFCATRRECRVLRGTWRRCGGRF